MFSEIERLNESEQEQVQAVIRYLLKHTYLVSVLHDPIDGTDKDNGIYKSCERYYDIINDYLSVMEISLMHEVIEGIYYISGEGISKETLSQQTIYIVLLLSVIYREKILGEGLPDTVTTLREIREQGDVFGLFKKNGKWSANIWREALRTLKLHNIIDVAGGVVNMNDESLIYIYPTINILTSRINVEQMLKEVATAPVSADNNDNTD